MAALNPDLLQRLATRLGQVSAGSLTADLAIHAALGRSGAAPNYTTDPAAAVLLVPDGYLVGNPQFMADAVYAVVRRSGLMPDGSRYPGHSSWGATMPLALAGAALWAQSVVVKG